MDRHYEFSKEEFLDVSTTLFLLYRQTIKLFLCLIYSHYEDVKRNGDTLTGILPRHEVEVCDEIHALIALPLGNELAIPIS
jgi:hypothetical protein